MMGLFYQCSTPMNPYYAHDLMYPNLLDPDLLNPDILVEGGEVEHGIEIRPGDATSCSGVGAWVRFPRCFRCGAAQPAPCVEVVDAIAGALVRGELTREQMAAAAGRIERCCTRFCAPAPPGAGAPPDSAALVGTAAHKARMRAALTARL
jgi:hypothetical protein